METPKLYYFKDDGITPNSDLPVVVYKNVTQGNHLADYFEATFRANGWANNWRDIIDTRDHYHSTTHEVLAIAEGEVKVQLGGALGKIFELTAGDVIIIPAGVGHFSIENTKKYMVVGGYPDGQAWDMIYNEPDQYEMAKQRILNLKNYIKLPI